MVRIGNEYVSLASSSSSFASHICFGGASQIFKKRKASGYFLLFSRRQILSPGSLSSGVLETVEFL
jgi:hypothetical protein